MSWRSNGFRAPPARQCFHGLDARECFGSVDQRGGPHFGSPDKVPATRLATLRAGGRAARPDDHRLLIGIGETRQERIESLLALRDIHDTHGHLQELIIQNFRAKGGTRMAHAPEPSLEEQLWTIAVARLLFGPGMSIQAPPNLQPAQLDSLVRAGINDWGGVSPVTPDHVNPEAPWPHLEDLARDTELAGRSLVERLALVPVFARSRRSGTEPAMTTRVRRLTDSPGICAARSLVRRLEQACHGPRSCSESAPPTSMRPRRRRWPSDVIGS